MCSEHPAGRSGERNVVATAVSNYCHVRRQRKETPPAWWAVGQHRHPGYRGLGPARPGYGTGRLGVGSGFSPNKLNICLTDRDTVMYALICRAPSVLLVLGSALGLGAKQAAINTALSVRNCHHSWG